MLLLRNCSIFRSAQLASAQARWNGSSFEAKRFDDPLISMVDDWKNEDVADTDEEMAVSPVDDLHREHAEAALAAAEAAASEHRQEVLFEDPLKQDLETFGSFEDPRLPQMAREILCDTMDLSDPTPIQSYGWAALMAQRDLVGLADTGTGKTLAFLLPIWLEFNRERRARFEQYDRKRGPPRFGLGALCLSPTRELAVQIERSYRELVGFRADKPHSGLKSVCVYGGVSRGPQIRALKTGARLAVATPGRLLDLHENGLVDFSDVNHLVLDEADLMLDMGFEEDVREILERIHQAREKNEEKRRLVTSMWSATWPKEIRDMASTYLTDFVKITVGESGPSACRTVVQKFVDCPERFADVLSVLQSLLASRKGQKTLIFVQKQTDVEEAKNALRDMGIRANRLHGNMSQQERTHALHRFREGRDMVLVATDVASRGLDVKDIETVVNLDFPGTISRYIHRIGRTGRAGAVGEAITFFPAEERRHAPKYLELLEGAGQPPHPLLEKHAKDFSREKRHFQGQRRQSQYGRRRGGRNQYGQNRNRNRRRSRY